MKRLSQLFSSKRAPPAIIMKIEIAQPYPKIIFYTTPDKLFKIKDILKIKDIFNTVDPQEGMLWFTASMSTCLNLIQIFHYKGIISTKEKQIFDDQLLEALKDYYQNLELPLEEFAKNTSIQEDIDDLIIQKNRKPSSGN